MLELLRKDASMFLSKILLGFIVLVFILYFGFNFTRGSQGLGQGAAAPIARVNGQIIPAGLFTQDVQNQMSLYQQFNTATLPPDTEQMVQGQVLQRLIQQSLLAEEAHRLGLRVPDLQLADQIRSNPSFRKDGEFREDFYLNQFKPFYEREFGQDYEYSLRQDLLGDKLRDALEASATVSEQEVQDAILMQETKLKLLVFRVPFKENDDASKQQALDQGAAWAQAAQDGKPFAKDLTELGAKEETLENKSLQELQLVLGGQDALPILSCLLKSAPNTVCKGQFPVKQDIVAVKLLERSIPTADAAKTDAMRDQLLRARKILTMNAVNDYLTKHAKIETYLKR